MSMIINRLATLLVMTIVSVEGNVWDKSEHGMGGSSLLSYTP